MALMLPASHISKTAGLQFSNVLSLLIKIRFNAPDDTTAVMVHTRLTTQGNQKFNQNNHPFPGHADKDFAFAHNGVLYNDQELRKAKNLPETHIETDSYVAVQLIEQQGRLDFENLKNMAETV